MYFTNIMLLIKISSLLIHFRISISISGSFNFMDFKAGHNLQRVWSRCYIICLIDGCECIPSVFHIPLKVMHCSTFTQAYILIFFSISVKFLSIPV